MNFRNWIIAATICFASPIFAGENFAQQHAGIWHGVGVQVDAQEWAMELQLEGDTALIDFSTSKCGGNWQFLTAKLNKILAVERITYGMDFCLTGIVVELTAIEDDRLYALWLDSDGEFLAGAVLHSGKMPEDTYRDLLMQTLSVVMGYVVGPMGADVNLKENKI